MRKRILIAVICIIAIIAQIGCGKEESVSDTGFYFDTDCTITLYNIDKKKAEKLIADSFTLFDTYEKMLSKTVKGSDIEKINSAKGESVEVSDETIKIITTGIEMGNLSGGAFDITIGQLTDLWDFGGDHPKVPTKQEIDAAMSTVDYRQIKIEGNKVTLLQAGAKLDVGGLAKGYISDRIVDFLVENGVTQGIVNLGGNVVTIGEKDDGVPWRVGINRPYSDRSEVIGTVPAKDKCVITSGIYERYFIVDGVQYHHIIDPTTGYPVENDLESVTIVGERGTSMECDAYSTICLLLGTEKSFQLLEQIPEVEALFLDSNDYVQMTKGMQFEQ